MTPNESLLVWLLLLVTAWAVGLGVAWFAQIRRGRKEWREMFDQRNAALDKLAAMTVERNSYRATVENYQAAVARLNAETTEPI